MSRIVRRLLSWLGWTSPSPASEVDILCLANSRKLSGRCIAGLRMDGGGWLRPVSAPRFSGTLSLAGCVLDEGSEASPFDVLRIPVIAASPEPHQPENWRLARGRRRLVERLSRDSAMPLLNAALVSGPSLLGSQSDRIPFDSFGGQPSTASLALIEPEAMAWSIVTGARGNRQTRARFKLDGRFYNLSVTDPSIERRLAGLPLGDHPRAAAGVARADRVLLTVSLGEPFGPTGDCYKLVAAVIVLKNDTAQTDR